MDAIADASKVKRLTHRETRLIVLGMLLPIFMGSLDQTILASALPTIGRDLGDAYDLPWLITAYLLASTAIIPLRNLRVRDHWSQEEHEITPRLVKDENISTPPACHYVPGRPAPPIPASHPTGRHEIIAPPGQHGGGCERTMSVRELSLIISPAGAVSRGATGEIL
jgi:hypothetical protein